MNCMVIIPIMFIIQISIHYHAINGLQLGLNINNGECLPFDSVSSHPSINGSYHDIGWIKIFSCIEHTDLFTFYRSDYKTISSKAISIKFQAPDNTLINDDMTIIAKPYSNPIIYGLNRNKELSFSYDIDGNIIGQSNLSNWIGTLVQ